jgi:hypothetical protein
MFKHRIHISWFMLQRWGGQRMWKLVTEQLVTELKHVLSALPGISWTLGTIQMQSNYPELALSSNGFSIVHRCIGFYSCLHALLSLLIVNRGQIIFAYSYLTMSHAVIRVWMVRFPDSLKQANSQSRGNETRSQSGPWSLRRRPEEALSLCTDSRHRRMSILRELLAVNVGDLIIVISLSAMLIGKCKSLYSLTTCRCKSL